MNGKILRIQIAAMLAATTLGCVGPLVSVVDLDDSAVRRLHSEVDVIESERLERLSHELLSRVDATSCRNKLWEPAASSENAIDQLRYKARELGANAVADVTCNQPGLSSLLRNCWSTVTCSGVAVRMADTEVSPGGDRGNR